MRTEQPRASSNHEPEAHLVQEQTLTAHGQAAIFASMEIPRGRDVLRAPRTGVRRCGGPGWLHANILSAPGLPAEQVGVSRLKECDSRSLPETILVTADRRGADTTSQTVVGLGYPRAQRPGGIPLPIAIAGNVPRLRSSQGLHVPAGLAQPHPRGFLLDCLGRTAQLRGHLRGCPVGEKPAQLSEVVRRPRSFDEFLPCHLAPPF